MDIQQLHSAVQEAFRRRDYQDCFQMLDRFLETATGHSRGRALNIKATIIMCEPRRAPEGLALVDEALQLLEDTPEYKLRCLTTGLGICLNMGDVDKASLYERQVHPLLQQHAQSPGIASLQFRPLINLGVLANMRGQPPTAYWHFIQAISCLESSSLPLEEKHALLLFSYLYISSTCILIGRKHEAAEALEKARPLVSSSPEDLGGVPGRPGELVWR